MPTAFTIRTARPTDDWAVQRLFEALHTYNAALDPRFALADDWPLILNEHLAHTRQSGHGLTLLAWHETMPAGLLMMDGHTDSPLFRHRRWAEVLALYVDPELRSAAVGQRLIAVGLTWAHQRGYERVQLYVTASNLPAKQFYARAGFQPVQEIWRTELGPSAVLPPDDLDCEAIYAQGHDLLTHSQHILGNDGDGCESRS